MEQADRREPRRSRMQPGICPDDGPTRRPRRLCEPAVGARRCGPFRRHIVAAIVGAAIALLLQGWPEPAVPARPDTDPTRIAGAVYLGDLPTVVADESGLFRGHGINASVEYLPSGKRSLERLRSGAADFALTALTPVVLDRLADPDPGGPGDPVILASLVHSTNLLRVVTLDDSGIETPADFAGHRVAVNRGTNSEFVWWLFEHYHGLATGRVEVVHRPFEHMVDGLLAGELDAAVLWEPRVSRLEQRLAEAGRALRHFHLGNVYAGKWVIVTSRAMVVHRPALCRKVLAAYAEAIDLIEQQPERAIQIYAADQSVDPEVLTHHWNELDYDLNLDWSVVSALQEQFLWARTVGYRLASGPLRVLEVIEIEPLRAVRPASVGIPQRPRAEATR